MTNLFINYYLDKNVERQKELDEALVRNIANPLIDQIIILYALGTSNIIKRSFNLSKLGCVPWITRPTYTDFFSFARYFPKDINIISNSDIYFDNTLQLVKDYDWAYQVCMALSRWENAETPPTMPDTQDTWIFKGAVPFIPGADFTLGTPGCDNKISWLLREAGYSIINPSLSINTFHLHTSGVRTNSLGDPLPPPYHLIKPATL